MALKNQLEIPTSMQRVFCVRRFALSKGAGVTCETALSFLCKSSVEGVSLPYGSGSCLWHMRRWPMTGDCQKVGVNQWWSRCTGRRAVDKADCKVGTGEFSKPRAYLVYPGFVHTKTRPHGISVLMLCDPDLEKCLCWRFWPNCCKFKGFGAQLLQTARSSAPHQDLSICRFKTTDIA